MALSDAKEVQINIAYGLLHEAGWFPESNNGGVHLKIRTKLGNAECWPTTNRWGIKLEGKKYRYGTGLQQFVEAIEVLRDERKS